MSHRSSTFPFILHSSYGTDIQDHLAADGAGFPGSQMAVVAIGQIDAHFLSDKHLEAVHGLTSLRTIDLIVVGIAHFGSLLCFLRKKLLLEVYSGPNFV